MIFSNTVSLLLALAPATIFAAPTKTVDSIANVIAKRQMPQQSASALENGSCDIALAIMPVAPTPLPSPAEGVVLSHVAIGRGTQNYTCSETPDSPAATPSAVGAVAQLFNATCQAVRAPAVLADVTSLALDHVIPTNDVAQHLLSGHHEFTAAGVPLFVLDTELNKYGYVQAKKNGSSDAPLGASRGHNDLGSVPWLKLTAVEGNYKEVYRLNTAGGVAPKTCEGIQGDFTVEYAAEYWFYQ